MVKFKAIFNYYLSAYWNNPRTLSSVYSFLKIFFERNNKIDSTVSSFGNVFRNSKWSNLQIQNIKKSFIKQWLSFFFIFLVILFLSTTYSQVLSNFVYLNFFFIKQTLNEFLTNIYYFIGCLLYQLYANFTNLFLKNQHKTISHNSLIESNNNLLSPNSNPNTWSAPKSNNLNLFFLQKTLINFESSTISNFDKVKESKLLSILPTFQNKINFSAYFPNKSIYLNPTSNLETKFILSKNLQPQFNQVITSTVTLNELQNTSNLFTNDPTLSENFIQGLNNIAKQQRWLTRNFWSNQSFTSDTNKITETKKFIQNPILNNNITDTNIWMSNKFSGTETEQLTEALSKLKYNPNILANFNFFDSSRFYTNQRYTFLNKLPNQFIVNTPLLSNTNLDMTTPTLNLKSKLLESYFSRNLTQNTQLYFTNDKNPTLNTKPLTAVNANIRYNVFITSQFSDLLQLSDLQTLNSINASTNSISMLQLNTNVSSKTFKA